MRAVRTQLALGLAVCSLVSSAHAQSPPLPASWRAPESCPQQSSFVLHLEGFLGRQLSAVDDRSLDVVGNVRADADQGYVAQLRVRTKLGSQQRELAHRDCAELTEAAALVSALAIDPKLVVPPPKSGDESAGASAGPQPLPPADAPPPTTPVAPLEPTTMPPASSSSRDAPRSVPPSGSLHPSLAVLGLVGSSILPGAGAGVGLFGALGPGRFRLAARGSYWFPRFQGVAGVTGPGIDLGAWGVGLKACALPLAGEVTLATCLGPELGDMYGTGNAPLTNPSTVHNRWSALSAELALAIRSSVGLTTLFGLELGKTLEAPIYGIRVDGEASEVFEAHAWTLNGYVGLGLFR